MYNVVDITVGGLVESDIDKRVFVLSIGINYEIVNRDYVENDKIKNVSVRIINIKCTFGCAYFLAQGIPIKRVSSLKIDNCLISFFSNHFFK